MIHLYVKTHNVTGLKYLGKTIQDPYLYRGSGKRWRSHLIKHGNDVTTTVIASCETKDELRSLGEYYSRIWNVVEAPEWANLKPEEGDGGFFQWDGMASHLKSIASQGGKARAELNYPAWNKGKKTVRSKASIEKQRATMTGKQRGSYKNYNHAASSTTVAYGGKVYPSISACVKDTGIHFTKLKQLLQTS